MKSLDRLEGQSCGQCNHFFEHDEGGDGQCRLGPPVIVGVPKQQRVPTFDRNTGQAGSGVQMQMQMTTIWRGLSAADPGCHSFDRRVEDASS